MAAGQGVWGRAGSYSYFLLLLHLLEAPAEPGVLQGFGLFARR